MKFSDIDGICVGVGGRRRESILRVRAGEGLRVRVA